MTVDYRVGDKVRIVSDNDNENYDSYRGKALRIAKVFTSTKFHPGFDESAGSALYDLVVAGTNEAVPFSLYDWELEKI